MKSINKNPYSIKQGMKRYSKHKFNKTNKEISLKLKQIKLKLKETHKMAPLSNKKLASLKKFMDLPPLFKNRKLLIKMEMFLIANQAFMKLIIKLKKKKNKTII
jgi:hypothetical protein